MFGQMVKLCGTDLNTKKMYNMTSWLACFVKVIETEMLFTILMQFLMIQCTSMHIFGAICATFVFLLPFFFVYAYSQPIIIDGEKNDVAEKRRDCMILGGKVANVGLTFISFLSLFISDMYFDIAEDVADYKP